MGTITIAQIKNNPKRSVVVTTEGREYGFWADKAAKLGLEPGGTYNIETDTFDTKNGTTLFNIISAKRVTMGAPSVAPERNPAPQQPGGGSYYRPTSPEDSERMFVCSLMNAFIQAGKIEPEQGKVIRAIEVLRGAYQATFGSDGTQHLQAAE